MNTEIIPILIYITILITLILCYIGAKYKIKKENENKKWHKWKLKF